jgi:hypothetical protein
LSAARLGVAAFGAVDQRAGLGVLDTDPRSRGLRRRLEVGRRRRRRLVWVEQAAGLAVGLRVRDHPAGNPSGVPLGVNVLEPAQPKVGADCILGFRGAGSSPDRRSDLSVADLGSKVLKLGSRSTVVIRLPVGLRFGRRLVHTATALAEHVG